MSLILSYLIFHSTHFFCIRFSRAHPAVIAAAAAAAAAAATSANPNGVSAPVGSAGPPNRGKNPVPQVEEVETTSTDAPWKLVAVSSKVQFTCALKDISMGGRADFKAIKTVIRCVQCILLLLYLYLHLSLDILLQLL